MIRLLIVPLLAAPALLAADFKAGVARIAITPQAPIWLSGYASRTHPSDGVVQDLWAKALALQDSKGHRAVIVTTDLIGLPRAISDVVAARVAKQYGLERSELVLNSIHTHTGPLLRGHLNLMFDLSPQDGRRVADYSLQLTDNLVTVIGGALGNLVPARLSCGHGQASFAMNRREPTPNGIRIGVNPAGPTDHDVPVLKVATAEGKLLAVLFGYACHNTTLPGGFYKIGGDYAGFAQAGLERDHPGVTAMFLMLCGADQNPQPRGTLELAQQHGQTLATEVSRVLAGNLRPIHPKIRTAFRMLNLKFAPQSREAFQKEASGPDPVRARRARAMLEAIDERRPISTLPYPVQAVSLSNDLTLLALGGEVVVDYALRAKREYGGLIVAGYSNDVMCYIPSREVLKAGGYEADQSMVYYGQPGPFTEEVEEDVFAGIHDVLQRAGRKPLR